MNCRVRTRRQVVAIVGAAVGALAVRLMRTDAFAQTARDDAAAKLAADRGELEKTVSYLRDRKFPMDEKEAQSLAETDYRRRLEEADALAPLSLEDARALVLPEYSFIFDAMVKVGISPTPEAARIAPLPYLPLPPPRKPPPPKDDKLRVIIIIILDGFGLLEVEDLCAEALRQVPGFEDEAKKIENETESGDAQRITHAIFKFGEWLLERQALAAFLENLATRNLANLLLRRLALRFVPFVGWGWMVVAFGLSINRHWRELTA